MGTTRLRGTQIKSQDIASDRIKQQTILEEDLANFCVTEDKLAEGIVVSSKIANNSVTAIKLNDNVAGDGLSRNPITHKLDVIGGISGFADLETPGGAIGGGNAVFTLEYMPITGSVHLWLNGILMAPGAGNDFTISGQTITMEAGMIPSSGSRLLASYRK